MGTLYRRYNLIMSLVILRRIVLRPIMFSLLSCVLIIVGVRLLGNRPPPEDPRQLVDLLVTAGLPEKAEPVFEQLLHRSPLDIDLHYRYISNHFEISGSSDEPRDDYPIMQRYFNLASQPETADIGNYGSGLIRVYLKDYEEGLRFYRQVADQRMKYLNNSIGFTLIKLGREDEGEGYLWTEINQGGNISGATGNLIDLYLRTNDLDKLQALAEDPRTQPYLDAGTRRWLAFNQGRVGAYLKMVFIDPWQGIYPDSWLSALLICGMWFLYLWRLDVFEQEPLWLCLLMLLLGGVAAELSLLGGDLMFRLVPVSPGNGGWDDLVYSILHIGLVEEVVKFLPVIGVMIFTKTINEPFDLLIYGSLSALGFATLENALYFTSLGVGISFSRFIISTVVHLAMTSLICYAWAWAIYYRRKYHVLAVAVGILLATLAHGLFDFFLLQESSDLSALSILILGVLAAGFGRMIAEALSASPFFARQKSLRRRLSNYELLISTAVLMLVVAFLYNNYTFTTEIAIQRFLETAYSSTIIMIIVFGWLGEIGLLSQKGKQTTA